MQAVVRDPRREQVEARVPLLELVKTGKPIDHECDLRETLQEAIAMTQNPGAR